jgi:hypothetical protein
VEEYAALLGWMLSEAECWTAKGEGAEMGPFEEVDARGRGGLGGPGGMLPRMLWTSRARSPRNPDSSLSTRERRL